MAKTKALPNGLELRDTCTPWHCAGAARQGKCPARVSGPLGTRPAFCAGKCPAARATVALFSHILGGKPRSIFPHASRVSRRPSTPGTARRTLRVRKRGRDGLPKDMPAQYRRCWVGTMCAAAQLSRVA
jgi:hypothetical protein